jgi:hypothetical protein
MLLYTSIPPPSKVELNVLPDSIVVNHIKTATYVQFVLLSKLQTLWTEAMYTKMGNACTPRGSPCIAAVEKQ